MTSFFRFSVSSSYEVRQFLGTSSYIMDVRPYHNAFEIMIRDTALDRIYFLETSASIAAEFDN